MNNGWKNNSILQSKLMSEKISALVTNFFSSRNIYRLVRLYSEQDKFLKLTRKKIIDVGRQDKLVPHFA